MKARTLVCLTGVLLVSQSAAAEGPTVQQGNASHPDTSCTMRTRGQDVTISPEGVERRTWQKWSEFGPAGALVASDGASTAVTAAPMFELSLGRARPNLNADWTSTVAIRPSKNGQRVYRTKTPATGECGFAGEAAMVAGENESAAATDDIRGTTGAQTKSFRLCFVSEDTSNGDRTRVEVKCVLTHNRDRDTERSTPVGGGGGSSSSSGAGTGQ